MTRCLVIVSLLLCGGCKKKEESDRKALSEMCMVQYDGIPEAQRAPFCACFADELTAANPTVGEALEMSRKAAEGGPGSELHKILGKCATSHAVTAYPTIVRANFVSQCVGSSASVPESRKMCECSIERIVADVPFHEFLVMEGEMTKGGDVPERLKKVFMACAAP